MSKRLSRSQRSPKFGRAAALLGLSLTASVLVPTSTVGAQANHECLGLTSSQAQAQGFVIRIGTGGDDVINGSDSARDFIIGLGGDDVINGGGLGDVICAGNGDDVINSGSGDDRVHGDAGVDEISLGAGNDFGVGGTGSDRIIGGTGNDRLYGFRGHDRLSGEDGNDTLSGGIGDDTIFGGFGADRINGRSGDDRLAGGPGNDHILGFTGHDIISGDSGNDRILGGHGHDSLDGDAGVDELFGNAGVDRCDTSDGDRTSCENTFNSPASSPPPAPAPAPAPAPVAPPTGSPVPASQAPQGVNEFGWPLLTDAGLAAMLHCESTTNHAINTGNGFFGGVQWLPNTWNAAAALSGFDQYVGVLPHLVPASVQDEVTKDWWAATRPNTQWPTCHKVALTAMNVLAP